MGSRRTKVALRRRAAIALAVWAFAFAMLAVAAAIPEGPTAVLAVDNPSPALGAVVHFDASGSAGHDQGNGRIVAYLFVFGDGGQSAWQQSSAAAHAYADPGAYTATVTVTDLRGMTGSASVTLRVSSSPPPIHPAPDLVPVTIAWEPAPPRVDDTVNLTVAVLNRGEANATSASIVAYDARPDGSVAFLGRMLLSQTLAPSQSDSIAFPPFVAVQEGNHTIRTVVSNVTPAEQGPDAHELVMTMEVLAPGGQTGPGTRGGPAFDVGPLAVGLSAVAVAAMAGAGYFLLRRPPKGPLEPPPAQPPDRSPPPIWPPQ